MENIIKAGSPVGTISLIKWNSYRTSVVTNSIYSYVYAIQPYGYMAQFNYIDGVINELSIIIIYRNINKESISGVVTLLMPDSSNVTINIVLRPTNIFTTLTLPVVSAAGVTQVAINIANNLDTNLEIADIFIGGDISSVSGVQVSPEDFTKYSILYGTEEYKPNLR